MKKAFLQRGVSLVEIIVSVFLIVIFSMILIADFPKIQRQFALSKASYKFVSDVSRARDMGFSGVNKTSAGNTISSVNSYGVNLNIVSDNKKYTIYANRNPDFKYDGDLQSCDDSISANTKDCVIDSFNLSNFSSSLNFLSVNNNQISLDINFAPPNPDVKIYIGGTLMSHGSVNIVLELNADNNPFRTIMVNTSGLINLQ